MYLSLLDLLRQGGALLGAEPSLSPELELLDHGHVLTLRAALQGIDPQSVQIQLGEQLLGIGGHRSVAEQTDGPDFSRYQAALSQFYRELPLPCRIDPHRATAHWEPDGTLAVTLPKA